MWQTFCAVLDVTVSLSFGYHPQSNDQTERTHQTLDNVLRCVMARHPAAWSSWLPWVEYAHNSLVLATSGISPFMASLGYRPPLSEYQEEKAAVPSVRANLCRCRTAGSHRLSDHCFACFWALVEIWLVDTLQVGSPYRGWIRFRLPGSQGESGFT